MQYTRKQDPQNYTEGLQTEKEILEDLIIAGKAM
jgi:hypothetical protein